MDYNTRSSLVLKEDNCVGQIQKIFGKEGELVVRIWDNFPEEIIDEPLWIEIDSKGVPLFVKSVKPQGLSKIVAVFEDWESEVLATELVGKKVYYELQDSSEDSDDIIGWTLKDNISGQEGTITDISASEVNPILFVRMGDRESLIPFVEQYIVRLDEQNRTIYMELPDGLLDL